MNIEYGKGTTEFGPGVDVTLTGGDVARAIYAYLVAHDIHVCGAATMRIAGELIGDCGIYVDPSGKVISDGVEWSGCGPKEPEPCEHEYEKAAPNPYGISRSCKKCNKPE